MSNHFQAEYNPPDYSFSFNTVGLLFYSFCVITILPSIRNQVISSSSKIIFEKLFYIVFFFSFIIYVSFISLCYLYFGEAIETNIFYNFNKDDGFLFYIQPLYLIVAIGSDMITFYPLADILYQIPFINSFLNRIKEKQYKTYLFKYFLRILIIGLCALISILNKGIVDFLSFTSSFIIGFLGAIMPTAYYIKFKRNSHNIYQKIFFWFMLFIGIVIWIICSWVSFIDLINEKNTSELLEKVIKDSLT